MIYCKNCGELGKDGVLVYNEYLRKQGFSISPVLPVCKNCGSETLVKHICTAGNIIILNGTCGSGKSTIAEILAQKGFYIIDGDCVIQVVRHKTGRKQYEWGDLINEIADGIDILSMFGENIVLSHIILPEDLDKYIAMFESRNLKYKFFLLKPDYQTAVERCRSRTCHTSVTPEHWIKHFYDLLDFLGEFILVDNTNMTAEETAEYIFKIAGF